MLAGLLRAPSRYAPTNDLEQAQERATVIVGLMEEQGYLSKEQAAQARAHPARLSAAAAARTGGAFADWVMTTGPDFLTRKTTEDVVVETTFDPASSAPPRRGCARSSRTRSRPAPTPRRPWWSCRATGPCAA